MFLAGLDIVRRIKIHPSDARTENREPRVGRVRTDEARLAFRRAGAQIPADVAGGQTERAHAGDAEMREVLADTAPGPKTSSSGVATVVALGSYLKSLKMRRVKSRAPSISGVFLRETFARVIRQLQRGADVRRVEDKLVRLDHLRRNRVAEQ